MEYTKIIAIDPGNSGGIVFWTNTSIHAAPMPVITSVNKGKNKNVVDVKSIQQVISEQSENHVVLIAIEKVTSRPQDLEDPGKIFRIQKMLDNYNSLLTVIKLSGFHFVEVVPRSWQKPMGLSKDKNANKEYAQSIFPSVKVTLKTADAICIMMFCRMKLKTDPKWISSRI